ncbi:unnamed protein product [Caenorhabditis sp. 36 PRJEB53466]|nr:unnamed protein product [Caenorhabditis sp. 36 PRJEB53466]
MALKRKRSVSEEPPTTDSMMKARKVSRKNWFELRVLPPTVMREIVEKMCVEEHMAFRAVCKYSHDEVESYWRSRRSISVPQLFVWFPKLADSQWRLTSLSAILYDLGVVFNLLKPGNLRKFSLRGVLSVNLNSLVTCVEKVTGKYANVFFENVGELDLRGCSIAPDHLKMINELFPNLHTILLNPNAVMPSKQKRSVSTRIQTEITHHITASTGATKTELRSVPAPDVLVMAFMKEHLPHVRHVFIDLDD